MAPRNICSFELKTKVYANVTILLFENVFEKIATKTGQLWLFRPRFKYTCQPGFIKKGYGEKGAILRTKSHGDIVLRALRITFA